MRNRFNASNRGQQSYSVYAAEQYRDLDNVFELAEIIMNDPIVIEANQENQKDQAKKTSRLDAVAPDQPLESTRPNESARNLMD